MTVGMSAANTVTPWLNCIRSGGTTRTVVSATSVQLHTADPGAVGTTAVSAGSATKVAATQAASAAGSALALNGTAPVWTNGGTGETLTHVSVWDGTTFLYSIQLTTPRVWASGDNFTLNTLGVSVAPQAA